MKKILFVVTLLSMSYLGFSQPCTANAPTGSPSLTPTPANIPCIQRGVPYSQVMQFENFTVFSTSFGNANVDWSRIDSVTNFPCGITWQADRLLFNGGETGCILVSGTSTEPVGQYPLKIYMTFQFDVPSLGVNDQQLSGELRDLESQGAGFGITIPLDVHYNSRVIETGSACPTLDPNATTLTSGATCLPVGIVKSDISEPALSIYPNPNTGVFEIDLATTGQDSEYLLRIFDAQGKTVYNETLATSGSRAHKTLGLDYLQSGIYTVNLNSISTSYIQKLVIY